jgi:hypothetical protein
MSRTTSIRHFIDVGDPGAPIGSPAWCKASHAELCAAKHRTDHEVKLLKYGLLEFRQKERWRLICDNDGRAFQSWEDYVQYPEPNGLGMPAESAKAVMEEVNDKALLGEVLGRHGGDHKSQVFRDQVGNANLMSTGGTTRPYILARLERDGHGELAARVRAGEMSARAAALQAGIRRPPDPLRMILRLLPRLDAEQCRRLREALDARMKG